MIDILALAFLFLGLLGMLKEWHIDATVYGDDLAFDRPSYGIPRCPFHKFAASHAAARL